jgi:hypothetical protein
MPFWIRARKSLTNVSYFRVGCLIQDSTAYDVPHARVGTYSGKNKLRTKHVLYLGLVRYIKQLRNFGVSRYIMVVGTS